METTMEMMGAHGMTHAEQATQMRGRDAFNAYCRVPGTRIARIYDDMDAGLDNLQIAIAYRMDIVDVNVYRAAWKAYSGGVVKRRPEMAGNGNELNARRGGESNGQGGNVTAMIRAPRNSDATEMNCGNLESSKKTISEGIEEIGLEKARQCVENKSNGKDWTREAHNSNGKAEHTSEEEKQTRDNQGGNAETHTVDEEAICCRTQRRTAALTTNAQPGHAQAGQVIDLAESVRALMAEGAGVSRIAARLGITRVKATLIMQKIERGG